MDLKPQYSGRWKTPDGRITSSGFLRLGAEDFKLLLVGLDGVPEESGVPLNIPGLSGITVRPLGGVGAFEELPCLLCSSAQGTTVSAFKVRLSRAENFWFGTNYPDAYLELSPAYVFLGPDAVEDLDEAQFLKSSYVIPGLELIVPGSRISEIFDKAGYVSLFGIKKDGDAGSYEIPMPEMTLSFHHGFKTNGNVRGYVIEQRTNFTMTFSEKQTIYEHEKESNWLLQLMGFISRQELRFDSVRAYTDKVATIQDGKIYYQGYQVLREGDYRWEAQCPKDFPLLTLGMIHNFAEVVERWMAADNLMQQNIVGWIFYWNNRYKYLLTTQFVEIMTILETLTDEQGDRRKHLPDPEFKSVSKALLIVYLLSWIVVSVIILYLVFSR